MFEILQINYSVYILFFLFYGGYSFIQFYLNYSKCSKENIENLDIKTDIKTCETKYEDKYLEKYIQFTTNLDLKENDLKNKQDKYIELVKSFEKTKEITLQNIKNEMLELVIFEPNDKLNEYLNTEEFTNLKNQQLQWEEKQPDIDQIEKESHEYMCELYYDRLKNNFVFENTPNGNIIMYYNNNNKSFEYYSDKSMPYRFLESVARKYVTMFYCKILYINMADELKNAETKMIEQTNKKDVQKPELKTKDVFVKLKNYNKETINKPYSSQKNYMKIPNHMKTKMASIQNQSSSENHILKENANRYTHKGKFSNFNILKQVDKIKTNKNYELSYKDYAEMIKK